MTGGCPGPEPSRKPRLAPVLRPKIFPETELVSDQLPFSSFAPSALFLPPTICHHPLPHSKRIPNAKERALWARQRSHLHCGQRSIDDTNFPARDCISRRSASVTTPATLHYLPELAMVPIPLKRASGLFVCRGKEAPFWTSWGLTECPRAALFSAMMVLDH